MSLSHSIGKKWSADLSGAEEAQEFSPAGHLGLGRRPALSGREHPGWVTASDTAVSCRRDIEVRGGNG